MLSYRFPWLVLPLLGSVIATSGSATDITLKNGSQYDGRYSQRASLAESPLKGGQGDGALKLIGFLEDGLRRTYFFTKNVTAVNEGVPIVQERIKISQPVAENGRRIGSLGPLLGLTPFDKYGRRTLTTLTSQGRLDIVQGITEVTPTYTKIEGLLVKNAIVCETRMATTSIPRETLNMILAEAIDQKKLDERLRIVRLFSQAERFDDAREELTAILKDFPGNEDLKKNITTLHQSWAERLLKEIERRRDSGQHRIAISMLQGFPENDVAGEMLIRVRDMLAEYEKVQEQIQQVAELIEEHSGKVESKPLREQVKGICDEIKAELNINNLDRMFDYIRLSDDKNILPEQKLSLAISSWLMGNGAGGENLAVSASLATLREKIREYLDGERDFDRAQVLESMQSLEGNTPENIARILANMKPPLITEAEWHDGVVGLVNLKTPGIKDDPEFSYFVQLPPDYDPYRKYPCVVTLNAGGTSELQQIDWWAGTYESKSQIRLGQGTRHGYIVIAPVWKKAFQKKYEYTYREHAAVLFPLRDAIRRFSIDTDRIFLSGHSMGGDAAWDIGLSHPDLWCGVLPISAQHDKYIKHYDENAKGLPLYFVLGEMDGNRLENNGNQFDRYLTRAGYDCTVVEYLGRGHESFQDEIQRIFTWMGKLPPRNPFPDKIICDSMRRSDNFFWWLELDDFSANQVVAPELFGKDAKIRPAKTDAHYIKNRVSVTTSTGKVLVWLAPGMVSFDSKVTVVVDGKTVSDKVAPSVETILEDVRTRGDRYHPFWARVSATASRRKP